MSLKTIFTTSSKMTEFKIEVPAGTPFPEVARKANGNLVYDIDAVKAVVAASGIPWEVVTQDMIEDLLLGWYMSIRNERPNPVMEAIILESHDVN